MRRRIFTRFKEDLCDGGGNTDDPGYNLDQQTELLLNHAKIHACLRDLLRANTSVIFLKLRVRGMGRFDHQVTHMYFSLVVTYNEDL